MHPHKALEAGLHPCKVRLYFRLGRRKSETYTAAPFPQSPQAATEWANVFEIGVVPRIRSGIQPEIQTDHVRTYSVLRLPWDIRRKAF